MVKIYSISVHNNSTSAVPFGIAHACIAYIQLKKLQHLPCESKVIVYILFYRGIHVRINIIFAYWSQIEYKCWPVWLEKGKDLELGLKKGIEMCTFCTCMKWGYRDRSQGTTP